MDIDNKDLISKIASNTVSDTKGIISKIYTNYQNKFIIADNYLAEQIKTNGDISQNDLETAARLYGISKLHRYYKNISKIVYSADNIAKLKGTTTGEIEDDWLNYFLDRAENISDESVQNIFAYILAEKCANKNSFRKVMIDRLALLDYNTAEAFLLLCKMTYEIKTSDNVYYSVPLYLRDDILYKMVKCKDLYFTENDAIKYQENRPSEGELEFLQEIGLIKLSDDYDECDIYSSKELSFILKANDNEFVFPSLYDCGQEVYYIITGCCVFTKVGIDLYNALKSKYIQNDDLFYFIKNYYEFQKFTNPN